MRGFWTGAQTRIWGYFGTFEPLWPTGAGNPRSGPLRPAPNIGQNPLFSLLTVLTICTGAQNGQNRPNSFEPDVGGVHRGPKWGFWRIRKIRVQTGLARSRYGPKWAISLLYRPSTRNKGSRARPGSVAREPGMAKIDPKIGVFLAISGPVLSRRGYQEAVFWAHFSGSPKSRFSWKSAQIASPGQLGIWPKVQKTPFLAKIPQNTGFGRNRPK